MPKFLTCNLVVLCGLSAFVSPPVAAGQTAAVFDGATLAVISELTSQDRGDGSGSYRLVTRVTDGDAGITIQHELTADRTVDQEVKSSESLSVLEGETEKAQAESDPTELGIWAEPAIAYAIPFDREFSSEPRKTYRPRDKQVADIARSAAPDAHVTTRAASDGRTTAIIEITGVLPITELAERFVGIREAFRTADVGLAKLQIKGLATTVGAEAASSQ
jgi:hypothetical protein